MLDLQDVFSDGDVLRQPNLADELIKGLTIQASGAFDNSFVEDVTGKNFLLHFNHILANYLYLLAKKHLYHRHFNMQWKFLSGSKS